MSPADAPGREEEVSERELARARHATLLSEKTLVYRAARRFFFIRSSRASNSALSTPRTTSEYI